LNVRELSHSLAFYRKLGFEKTGGDEQKGYATLAHGNLILGLYQGHIERNRLNFRDADVFAVASELKRRGIQMKSDAAREDDGSVGATFEDPDGNLIYLNT